MGAKEDLLERTEYLEGAIQEEAVINKGVTKNRQSQIAGTLRKGLGIVAFNILEDFIKIRTQEALDEISSSLILFENLTDELKEACTLNALKALGEKATIGKRNGADWMNLIQQEAQNIASAGKNPFKISKYSLAMQGSNLNQDTIPTILKAFGIKGAWPNFTSHSNNIGTGVPSPVDAFINAAQRRHSAAHDPTFDYEYSFLSSIVRDIHGIAVTFDIMISARLRQIKNVPSKKIGDHSNIAPNYRFLEQSKGGFRETLSLGGRARKIWADLDDAVRNIQPGLLAKNEFLIVINDSGIVQCWYR